MSSKKMSRREFLKVAGIGVGSIVLASCAPQATEAPAPAATQAPAATEAPTKAPSTGPVTGKLTVMHKVQEGELTADMVTQFQNKYPGITVDTVQDDLTLFFSMYAAGNPPDIVRVQAPSVPPYLARGMLFDLTPYFQASAELRPDDLAPANKYYQAEDALHVGSGKIYGMCKDWSPDFTIFGYKKAFDAKKIPIPDDTKPLTYAEVYDLGKKLAVFDGDRVVMFGFDYPDDWVDRIWMNILGETGDLLFNADYSKINLKANDKAKEILQYFFSHAKEKVGAVSAINPSPNWIGDDFDKGFVATIMYGYWFSGMAESDVTKDQVFMLPAPTWAGVRRDPTMTATGMVMAASTKIPDVAWKFFQWYNAEEPAEARAGSGWGVPALKSQYSKMPSTSAFQQQVQNVLKGELDLNTTPLQFNPYLQEKTIANAWLQYLQQAVAGSITFDDLISSLEFDVNTAIQDGKAAIGG